MRMQAQNGYMFLVMFVVCDVQGIDCRASFDDSDAGRAAAAKGKELMMMGEWGGYNACRSVH